MSHHIITRLAGGVMLLLTLSLVGCGRTSSGPGYPSQNGGSASPTSPTHGAESTPGSAALNGCSIQQAPTDWPPANVVFLATSAQGATVTASHDMSLHVTVTQQQIIDVRLDATYRWSVTASPSPAVLAMAQPAGWYDATQRQCVWRFTAASTGVTGLQLTGPLVCPPQTPCPALAAIASYVITVK